MREIEISTKTVFKNMKANLKLMICVFLVCTAVGAVAGAVFSIQYQYDKEKSAVPEIALLEVSDLERDEKYYYNVFWELEKKYKYIESYLAYFELVVLSDESRATLDTVRIEMDKYDEELKKATTFYMNKTPVLYESLQKTIDLYEDQIKDGEADVNYINEEIKEIVDGYYTEAYKISKQDSLRSDREAVEKNIKLNEKIVENLRDMTKSESVKLTRRADRIQEKNYQMMNDIVVLFNDTLAKIAEKENYEIVYNEELLESYVEAAGMGNEISEEDILAVKKNRAIVYATSVAGLDQKQERFLATLTFFMLFGFTLAVVVGATNIFKKY